MNVIYTSLSNVCIENVKEESRLATPPPTDTPQTGAQQQALTTVSSDNIGGGVSDVYRK